MTSTRGISVVIPCHNTGHYILEAVTSVLNQPARTPLEVIVVDDGSDDPETRAALTECRIADNVDLVRLDDRLGVQRARTIGVLKARYRYVLPLDGDDRLSTDPPLLREGTYLDRAVTILDADPDVAFVHTLTRMFGNSEGLTISSYPCREDLVIRKHHVPATIVYRRADGVAAGLYDKSVRKWQDWAFAVSLLAARHRLGTVNRIGFIDGPYVQYRIHTRTNRISTSEVSESEMTFHVVNANLDYFRHHYGDHSAEHIAAQVHHAKPSRLVDLLHMAHHDLGQALTVAQERDADLTSHLHQLGVP